MPSHLRQDVLPVTDLMQQAGKIIKKIQHTKRPVLITQNGRAAMVCLDVKEYQRQLKRLRFVDALLAGERAFAAGQFSDWDDFKVELRKM